MDLSAYRDLFVSEARKHVDAIGDTVIRLETEPDDRAGVDDLFRHAHSLKGMAATMQYYGVSGLAHKTEDLLGRVRNNEFAFSPGMATLIIEVCNAISSQVSLVENGETPPQEPPAELLSKIENYQPSSGDRPHQSSPGHTGSLQASESQASRVSIRPDMRNIRVRAEVLDRLVTITGELHTVQHRLADSCSGLQGSGIDAPLKDLSLLLRQLRDQVFQARMVPFSLISDGLPRVVRELAGICGKEVSFSGDGLEMELDRSILEQFAEPLLHIVRNAVDHGMEPPEIRIARGKPKIGRLHVSLAREKDHVTIRVSDDGAGISVDTVAAKALEKGLVTQAQLDGMTLQDRLMLVCMPGLSTASKVTGTSGRGVGMDAVRDAVRSLGGSVFIESEEGAGTEFVISLPTTVSIINALLAASCGVAAAFPVSSVRRSVELPFEDVISEGMYRTHIDVDGERLRLKSLSAMFGINDELTDKGMVQVVIIDSGSDSAAVAAAGFIGQKEIFVKPLLPPLAALENVSGYAVLGDGQPVFVLDAASIARPSAAPAQSHL